MTATHCDSCGQRLPCRGCQPAALGRKDALLRQAMEALECVTGLIGESVGVYGLHLNGDPSPWGELVEGGRFERLIGLDEAVEAIEAELSQSPAPAAPAPLRMLTKDECHELAETVGLGSASVQRMFCEVNNLGEPK
jgi:hypothetical protein